MSVSRFLLLALAALLFAGYAMADVPTVISYQGKLMESSGIPVTDSTCQMTFAIYDSETGGTRLWTEANPSVQVKGGLFSVLLGSITPLPTTLFDGADRWFGVTIGSASELTPRQKIASAAFAQVSRTVVDGSITVTKLGDRSVTGDKIADLAVTTGKLASGSVTGDKVANGTITADKLASGLVIPTGGIIMWSGTTPPPGWALCDGTNGTPDLRNKFIVASGSSYPVGSQGAGTNTTLNLSHSHLVNDHSHGIGADGNHNHLFLSGGSHDVNGNKFCGRGLSLANHTWYYDGRSVRVIDAEGSPNVDYYTWWNGNHSHGGGTGGASSRGTDTQLQSGVDVRPPYYALAFIMKQ